MTSNGLSESSAPTPNSDPQATGPKGKRRDALTRWLKILFALALLAYVGQSVPWSDSLIYIADPAHASDELRLSGELVGDWRGAEAEFRLAARDADLSAWPAAVRAAVAESEVLHVLRRAPEAAGLDWRPGMPRVFIDLRGSGLVGALAGLLLGLLFGVTRWWRLLHLANCPSSWPNTLRLALLGFFFNLVMPGITGGDLPKAVLVVREHPERRADAFATVVIDRLVGMWALVLIANTILWTTRGFEVLRIPGALTFLAMSVALAFLLMPGPRRALGLDRWIERLPQARRIKKLEQAALIYRGRPRELVLSILLSLGNHFSVIFAVFAIGSAFGDALDLRDYVGIVPVANLISALPLSPGGWGVGEAVFGTLFDLMGDEATIGVAVSVTFRLCTVALGMVGGVFLLLPGSKNLRSEVQAARVHFED